MEWNSFRRKVKVSSSSSLTKPPASHRVVGSNSPDGLKTLGDVTFVLKHRVYGMDMEVPSYCAGSLHATTLSSTLVLLGDLEKNPENPARSEKNWLTNGMWDVTCCMMKAAAGDKEER